ncbi:hypothetical protein [Streptomyces sp. NPDC059459]|uniref:hypothetical protein n=1 Tax=unclassified Streptomyces TaxID=2593676 RepID=UPI0036C30588
MCGRTRPPTACGPSAASTPTTSLPALRDGLVPGAPLVFSALHADAEGRGPSGEVVPRGGVVRLRDEEPVPVRLWALSPRLWEALLAEHGFTVDSAQLLSAPDGDTPAPLQFVQARRRR